MQEDFTWILWVVLGITLVIVVASIIFTIQKKKVVKLFEKGNVSVAGMKGEGKDLLFCVVVNDRKKDYISNVNYSDPRKKYKCFPLDLKVWELAGNSYEDFINETTKRYVYPYPDDIDYYISDAGVYFPSQYQDKLVKKYQSAPFFQALSRHLGDCRVHTNTQKYHRVWDKIREQSELYVRMDGSKVIRILGKKYAWISLYTYDNEESFEKSVVPPFFGLSKEGQNAKFNFRIAHGKISHYAFLTPLPYEYDSRRFKRILENECKDYEYEEVKNGKEKK